MSAEDGDPEKERQKREESAERSIPIKQYFDLFFSYVAKAAGFHPSDIHSEDPAVQEDASRRRIEAAENIQMVTQMVSAMSPVGSLVEFGVGLGQGDEDVALAALPYLALDAATLGKGGGIAKGGKIVSKVPTVGRKLDYLFGKATGRLHNLERSATMQRQLNSIGIYDNLAGRSYLKGELGKALNSSNNILRKNGGYTIRESLLMGPNGGLLMESRWQGSKLNTVILRGRK